MSDRLNRRPARSLLGVERLEDRTTPAFGPAGGGLSIAVGTVFADTTAPYAFNNNYIVGNGPGQPPIVRVYKLDGTLLSTFYAFDPSFLGGVHVAVANINGSTQPDDIVVGAGMGGGPEVAVFDGIGQLQFSFYAYEPSFRGGVNVAAGPVLTANQATDNIVTGAGPGGGPVVGIWSSTGANVSLFDAYDQNFRGGVNVAVGDFQTSGVGPDTIVTGAGPGGSTLVKEFQDGGNDILSFYAFGDISSRVGTTVAAGNTDPFITDQIFVAYNTSTTSMITGYEGQTGQIVGTADAFPAGYTDSLNMAVGLVNLNGVSGDLVVVSGQNSTNQVPRVFFGSINNPAPGNGP